MAFFKHVIYIQFWLCEKLVSGGRIVMNANEKFGNVPYVHHTGGKKKIGRKLIRKKSPGHRDSDDI